MRRIVILCASVCLTSCAQPPPDQTAAVQDLKNQITALNKHLETDKDTF